MRVDMQNTNFVLFMNDILKCFVRILSYLCTENQILLTMKKTIALFFSVW